MVLVIFGTQMKTDYFLQMIIDLRTEEKVTLYDNILATSENENWMVESFLEKEYKTESLDFPYSVPVYDKNAALWGAKLCYVAAQLILYRQNKKEELEELTPKYTGEMNASTILSADLCLRFVPQMMFHLKAMDPEDSLIPLLQNTLNTWHYSNVANGQNGTEVDVQKILENPCLKQLYVDRIIAHKNKYLAQLPSIYPLIVSTIGIHKKEYWPSLELTHDDEQ